MKQGMKLFFRRIASLCLAAVILLFATCPGMEVNADSNTKPAVFSGITCETQSSVKQLGQDFSIKSIEEIEEAEEPAEEPEAGSITSGGTGPSTSLDTGAERSSVDSSGADLKSSDIKKGDSKLPHGSKYMIVNKKNYQKMNPKKGDVFIWEDPANHKYSAFKVAGEPDTGSPDNIKVPFVQPQFGDIFKSYRIPQQKVQLNKSNVNYIAHNVQVDGQSQAASGSNSSAGKSLAPIQDQGSTLDGRKAVKLSISDYTLYTTKGDGVDARVYIDNGTITFTEPEVECYMDFKWSSYHNEIGIRVKSDCRADVTVKGDINIDKNKEILLYGYDLEIPKGKVGVGVYLEIDVKGKVNVTVRTITNGVAEAGVKADLFYCVPYNIGPYAEYNPKSFDTSFLATGDITAAVGVVPQAYITVCDVDVLKLKFAAGIKANAKFDISAGTADTGAEDKAEGSLKLDGYIEGKAWLLGNKINLFYKDMNIYDGKWGKGEEVNAGEGDAEVVPMVVNVYPNLVKNTIQGRIWRNDPLKADGMMGADSLQADENLDREFYTGDGVKVIIKKKNGEQITIPAGEKDTLSCDAKGRFSVNYNLMPDDRVSVTLSKRGPGTGNGPVNYKGSISSAVPIFPYSFSKLNADAFNDRIEGSVMAAAGGNEEYNGPVDIVVYDKNKNKKLSQTLTAKNGDFSVQCNLTGGDTAVASMPYKGAVFPITQDGGIGFANDANIDSLRVLFNNYYAGYDKYANKYLYSFKGTIQNTKGTKLYTGKVHYKTWKLYDPITGDVLGGPTEDISVNASAKYLLVQLPAGKVPNRSTAKPNLQNISNAVTGIAIINPKAIVSDGWQKLIQPETSTSFDFGYVQEGVKTCAYIEYEGIKQFFYDISPTAAGMPELQADPKIKNQLDHGDVINPADVDQGAVDINKGVIEKEIPIN